MADLTNRSVVSSYKELLKTASGDGLSAALTIIEDGDATASSLQLATNAARLTGTLAIDGITTLNNTTDSSTKDNGSLVVEGGVGIEKTLNVGGDLNVTGNAVIQGTLTANGGTLTLGDANTDNVVFQADVNSDIKPNIDDTYSLGSNSLQWRDLYVNGSAYIDNLDVHDSAQINPQGPVTISPSTGSGTLLINPAGTSSMNNVTIGANTPRAGTFTNLTATTSQVISATTSSSNKDTGALVVEGGVGIEENLNVGGSFGLTGNAVITGDVAVNGGDLTTTAATFNLLNTNATTLNLGGAATSISVGAATGTTTINHSLTVSGGAGQSFVISDGSINQFSVDSINGNTITSGDVAVNGGDLTTNQSTFNLLNTNATTVNFAGAGTTVEIGAATGTTNVNNNLDVDGDVNIDGGDLTVSTATFNLANTTATTLNLGGAATALNVGAATGTLTIGNPTITGTNATALNLNGASPSIVTTSTGTASVFNTNALTGNLFGAATSVSIGAATGTTTVNHSLTVAGGTGQSFIVNDGTTSRFTVDSTNGNTAISGTLAVTGATTLTDDLAVNGGDLTTNQTTFNLLNGTATTLNIGGAATTVELGAASGTTNVNNNLVVDLDLQVKGGDLTTDQTTFNLLNATATTVNFAGAATTVEIGAATGTTSVNNDLTVDGNTTLGNATSDTVTFTARAASSLVPSTDDASDLGASTLEWKDLFIDGTAKVDTLTVDENASVAGDLTVTGNLTVNGTTTNINTTNLVVEDKNIVLGDVATPSDVTADGGGITLKGATDKTLNWVDSTDSWTSSEHVELASGKNYRINGASVLSATTLGSGVTASSLTQTGTVTSGTWSSTVLTNDDVFTIRDNADNTKRFQFQASGITAGQTRTLTVTDADQTLVGFTGTSSDSWNWDTDFDHITVVIPGVGTRKIPYYA